jgi:hypothetical protein
MGDISHYIPVGLPHELVWAFLFLAFSARLILYVLIQAVRDVNDHW